MENVSYDNKQITPDNVSLISVNPSANTDNIFTGSQLEAVYGEDGDKLFES